MFSILANEFKTEILTVEDLKMKILNAPIVPKPICQTLLYTFGWNSYITDHLTNPPLKNHSKYNSFLISKEDGHAKLRAKKLPQHTELVPRAGIRLLKEDVVFEPVGPADFRIWKLKFDEINKGLHIFLAKLPLEKRMSIQTSWDGLRSTLEGLPRRSDNLEKMLLTDLPKQIEVHPTVPEHLRVVEDTHELAGDLYPEEIFDGHLEDEVHVGMDVCIYTEDLRTRPWVGRIIQIRENKRFVLQWYSRKSGRGKVFMAVNNSDGSPSLSELDNDTVMFWMMSEPQSRSANSFALTPYWLETIQREYEEIDNR